MTAKWEFDEQEFVKWYPTVVNKYTCSNCGELVDDVHVLPRYCPWCGAKMEARVWLQRHADNTPMPGAREAYRTILEELERTRWIPVEERLPKKQSWYHVVILDTKTKRKKVKQDLFAVELAKKYGHNVGFCKDGRQEGRERVIMWMPLPEPPGGGIMDGLIKFPTVYMDDETAVNIVKHSLTYLEGDGLTFEAMTYAIERVAMTDLTRWDISNAKLQHALRWLFDHYDFK